MSTFVFARTRPLQLTLAVRSVRVAFSVVTLARFLSRPATDATTMMARRSATAPATIHLTVVLVDPRRGAGETGSDGLGSTTRSEVSMRVVLRRNRGLGFRRRGGLHPVPAGALRAVEGGVGPGEKGFRRFGGPRRRDGDADGDRHGNRDRAADRLGLDGLPDPFGAHEGVPTLGFRQENRELLSPHPGRQVAPPAVPPQEVRDRDQHLVADSVAVAVVDRFEAVEVEEEEAYPLAAPPSPSHFRLHRARERPPVGEVRERVREGEAFEELVLPGELREGALEPKTRAD